MLPKRWVVQCEFPDGQKMILDRHTFRSYRFARAVADMTELFCFEQTGQIWVMTPVRYTQTKRD